MKTVEGYAALDFAAAHGAPRSVLRKMKRDFRLFGRLVIEVEDVNLEDFPVCDGKASIVEAPPKSEEAARLKAPA